MCEQNPNRPVVFVFRVLGLHLQKRAKEEVTRAQSRGKRVCDISVSASSKRVQHDPDAEVSQPSITGVGSAGDDEQPPTHDTDEEARGADAASRRTRLNIEKIVECREKSRSAWLHFPHVELVFLLFAFEGAVACQVSTIRQNVSPISSFLAVATLVSSELPHTTRLK